MYYQPLIPLTKVSTIYNACICYSVITYVFRYKIYIRHKFLHGLADISKFYPSSHVKTQTWVAMYKKVCCRKRSFLGLVILFIKNIYQKYWIYLYIFSQLNAAVFVIDKSLEHLTQCRGVQVTSLKLPSLWIELILWIKYVGTFQLY
jgi:hypothetical protein